MFLYKKVLITSGELYKSPFQLLTISTRKAQLMLAEVNICNLMV